VWPRGEQARQLWCALGYMRGGVQEEEDFYVRYHTLQLLTILLSNCPQRCALPRATLAWSAPAVPPQSSPCIFNAESGPLSPLIALLPSSALLLNAQSL